ncbi:hypothetical protein AMAG_17693 [Allomyces macrogynus ATCC 38327]|uniref:Uncharacterized protein n=1 Tax=Allomyces macrogynus (strain ATCC 38327) TaxID=578462 RepID=A0A0L0RX12_ALLM3|nr:hypothetical protein, variant [Allomyces macrogynus ATCC 38327]KNE54670.1 hypothetical protein AMAG_17693 [Allomyces macrogynus ATCC 38327]|eukprot:KNE54669.1 hypothetical protein, variant [Allomyces macrogynus ATCC 38327]
MSGGTAGADQASGTSRWEEREVETMKRAHEKIQADLQQLTKEKRRHRDREVLQMQLAGVISQRQFLHTKVAGLEGRIAAKTKELEEMTAERDGITARLDDLGAEMADARVLDLQEEIRRARDTPTLPVARTASPPRACTNPRHPRSTTASRPAHHAPPPPPTHNPIEAARRLPANPLTHHAPAASHAPPMPVAAAVPAAAMEVFPIPDPATAEWSATETDWRNEVVEWGIDPRDHPIAKVVAQKCKEIVERHRRGGGARGPPGEFDRSRQDRERERPGMRHGGGGGGGGGYHDRGTCGPPGGGYFDRDHGHHSRDDRGHGHGGGRRDDRGHGSGDYRDDRARGGGGYRDERGPPGRGVYRDERGYGGGGDRRGHDRRH